MSEAAAPFGALLRRYRALAGLSQEALAERSGLSRRGIADLERGARRYPYGDTAARLAAALALDPSERASLLAAGVRPPRATEPPHYALPVEPSPVMGRQRELAELRTLLLDTRLLTLIGPGGIGKTRLAQEVGSEAAAGFTSGAAFVDLAPLTEGGLVLRAVADALAIRVPRDGPLLEALSAALAAQHVLLVVDNCEHVRTDAARLVDALLRRCPKVCILATSREALRTRGETAYVVPPLASAEAAALFVDRARAAKSTLLFTARDTALIEQICARLDGVPLAIELAAARVPALGLSDIAERLVDRLDLLSSDGPLETPRHQTLRAAIEWSLALLSDQQRRLFERLSVFSGGWTLMAAERVCGWGILEPRHVPATLADLVDRSLVVAEERDGTMRYRLLETIRDYASEQLAVSAEAAEARRRHGAYFRYIAEAGAVSRLGLRYPPSLDLITREHDNMRAALSAALTAADLDTGLGLCEALGGYWVSQGYLTEGEEWVSRFLALAEADAPDALARILHVAGRLAEYHGEFDRARAFHEHSLSVARARDDPAAASRAWCGLGDVALHQGRYEEAVVNLQQALSVGRADEPSSEIAQALLSAGRAAGTCRRAEESRRYFEAALRMYRRLTDRWGVAYALNELALLARRQGRLEQAQAMHEESHVLWRQSGSRMGERAALMNLTLVALEGGALARAAALALDSLELCQDMADHSASTVRCVEISAQVLLAAGRAATAVSLLAAAESWRKQLGAPVPPDEQPELANTTAEARRVLSAVDYADADGAGRIAHIDEAVDLAAVSLTAVAAPPRH